MQQVAPKFEPNTEQKQCIEYTQGKCLVLAGPGTGKTYTITEKVKHLVKNGLDISKILCLTFTDAASVEMKNRIEKELNRVALDMDILTYHSFCIGLIEDNRENFELPPNYKVITDEISRAIIKDILTELDEQNKVIYHRTEKNDIYYYIGEIKTNIETIKRKKIDKEQYIKNLETNPEWIPLIARYEDELIDPKKYAKKGRQEKTIKNDIQKAKDHVEKAKELWTIYEIYQKRIEERHYLDFSDMINYVLDKFEKDESFLEEVTSRYEHILVDEYQDTNEAQNSIILHLAKKSNNITLVGDDDQIIYGFQGAKLDTMEKFLKTFPETKVFCLVKNMRSTQKVLDCARKIMLQDVNRLENNKDFKEYNICKELTSTNPDLQGDFPDVRCVKFPSHLKEYNLIVDEIEELIKSEDCPKDKEGNKKFSEIAILTKTNRELDEFAQLLEARNIPYELKEGKNIFEINAVNMFYKYIQMLCNPTMYANNFFQLLLVEPFNINSKDFTYIRQESSKDRTFLETLDKIDKNELVDREKIEKFVKTFEYLTDYKNKKNIKQTIFEIGRETGIFEYYLNQDINRAENIAGIKKLADVAEEYSNVYGSMFLESFVEYLNLVQIDDIQIKTDKAKTARNAVQLSTYCSSKGREFEIVYMPTLVKSKWESTKTETPTVPFAPNEYKTKDELKEEIKANNLRLLFVGMTRAKHTLRLSYVQEGKADLSCYISNFQELLDVVEVEQDDDLTISDELLKVVTQKKYDYKTEFKELITNILGNRSFSPSAINTYLKCPRMYLYSKLLELSGTYNLTPDATSYGTSIHYALEQAVKYVVDDNNECYPPLEFVIEKFKEEMERNQFSDYAQRKKFLGFGVKTLTKYYEMLKQTPVAELDSTELKINFELDNIKFYGIIDRVDRNPDGTYNLYDYKTGNKKTTNIICPEGDHEDYYNQLGLYKYFFEQSTGNKVSETAFLFPDASAKVPVCYNNDDIEQIVDKFKQAIKDIYNMQFEPSYKEVACKYCGYKHMCNKNVL